MRYQSFSAGSATVVLSGLLVWAACGPAASAQERIVYSATFDSPRDTVGWVAYGMLRVGPESPFSRRHALWVSGTCLAPHAYHELPASPLDRKLVLRAVARNVRGGSLWMGAGREYGAFISVVEDEWHAYESSDTLFCPAGAIPFVEISAGGIMEGGMFVERVEVVRVP